MECPTCKAWAAHPYLAGTVVEADCIRVGLRCHECKHAWEMDLPTKKMFPPLSAPPKPVSSFKKIP